MNLLQDPPAGLHLLSTAPSPRVPNSLSQDFLMCTLPRDKPLTASKTTTRQPTSLHSRCLSSCLEFLLSQTASQVPPNPQCRRSSNNTALVLIYLASTLCQAQRQALRKHSLSLFLQACKVDLRPSLWNDGEMKGLRSKAEKWSM